MDVNRKRSEPTDEQGTRNKCDVRRWESASLRGDRSLKSEVKTRRPLTTRRCARVASESCRCNRLYVVLLCTCRAVLCGVHAELQQTAERSNNWGVGEQFQLVVRGFFSPACLPLCIFLTSDSQSQPWRRSSQAGIHPIHPSPPFAHSFTLHSSSVKKIYNTQLIIIFMYMMFAAVWLFAPLVLRVHWLKIGAQFSINL